MTNPGDAAPSTARSAEHTDLLAALASHRDLLRRTVRDLTDEQARERTTVSELCLGGLIKHVAEMERRWTRFATGGAEAMESVPVDWANQFRMLEGETLEGVLADFSQAASGTDAFLGTADLDRTWPLPSAPWFEPGASWSIRMVVLHLIGEISQHSGHADIIRESLDGAKTMG
ncbi:putative damage-inducible protein DinB [Catenulispora sp. MAP12-49]|uniref:DinB family protein n=1 Tax=Catenulispora sp. MAP12-49 TaxID=3156302 RepID=UPI003517C36D